MASSPATVDYYRTESATLVSNGDLFPDDHAIDHLLNKRTTPIQRTSHSGTYVSDIQPVTSPVISSRNRTPTRFITDDLNRHMEELDNHRRAVRELTEKILTLNEKRVDLERENGDLRQQLDKYLYTTKPNFEVDDKEQLDPTELRRRYAVVKGKLKRQSGDLKEYREKVVELQKKLIEKNEREKDLLLNGDPSQNSAQELLLMQQLRSKREQVANLEVMFLKQQRVIDQLEKRVNSRSSKDNQDQRVNDILREENHLLHSKLEETTAKLATERQNGSKLHKNDEEMLRLQQKLEVSEERAKSLEKQLDDSARRWSREKADLQLRLREATLGLSVSPFPSRFPTLPNVRSKSDGEHRSRDYQTRPNEALYSPHPSINKPARYSSLWQ